MNARSQSVVNVGVACAATLFGLALAEGALRTGYAVRHARTRMALQPVDLHGSSDAYDDPGDLYGKYDTNPAIDYSSYLGYVSRAGARGNGYTTNVHHARYDADFPAAKPAGERRVFVTGGSTAWGQGVRQDQLFTNVAERRLSAPGAPLRVVSMGVTAYGSVQERILVENLLLDLAPDVVVMFSGWNDCYFGYSGKDIRKEQDFFKFRQVLARSVATVEPPAGRSKIQPPQFEDYASKLHYFLAVRYFALRNRDRAVVEEAVRRQALPPQQVLATLTRNVEILASLARRHGFRLVLYLQPTIYATEKPLSHREQAMARAAESALVGFPEYSRAAYALYRRELPSHAARECYEFADGDEAIRREQRGVFVDHVHFGSRGNRLLGEHLAAKIPGWLEPRPACQQPR